METEKGGDKAYVLLRQALFDSKKIALAKVVIKTRQHLAAIKPQKTGLMMELMHFPEEVLDAGDFKAPAEKTLSKAELDMAKKLIDSMSTKWNPTMFKDDYHEKLEKIVGEKIHSGGKATAPVPKRKQKSSNVIDLVSVLQKSIESTQGKSRLPARPRKKAA
jgi:DNA end-binding protein Ku